MLELITHTHTHKSQQYRCSKSIFSAFTLLKDIPDLLVELREKVRL